MSEFAPKVAGDKGGKTERVVGRDLADLQGRLANYVGSGGRLTPFTKCLTLYLPIPSLQGVDVVDTPGVNDPVRSREERTMEELHNCDVVFVVSPAGQFLNRQDLDLMGRLTYKDGVREVFLVASQVDGQLFGSERDKHDGRLPDVLQGLCSTLANSGQQHPGGGERHQSGAGYAQEPTSGAPGGYLQRCPCAVDPAGNRVG